jgi:tetratricopeptide (TPR) repeat protein
MFPKCASKVFLFFLILFLSSALTPCVSWCDQNGELPAAADSHHERIKLAQVQTEAPGSDKEPSQAKPLTMKPQEMEAIESKLTEALILYYDGKFGQALPIFNAISTEVETLDIMWWIGTSAMKTGKMQLAVKKFQKMLALDPKLYRVRLELAAAYFSLGKYEEAKKELDIVKASNPPEEVLKNIEKLLAAIEESTRKIVTSFRFSQGLQWDTNISSGPDKRELNVTGGMLTLGADSGKLRDWASITNVSGSVLYDMGERQGLMWNTSAELYNSSYFNYGKFNYMLLDVTTGPWWVERQDIVKVPLGVSNQEYGSDRLSWIFHISPNYEHYFNPNFSLRALYSVSRENFFDASKNNGLDNTTRRYELSPNIFLNNRRHILSIAVGHEDCDAEVRSNSYSARYLALSFYTKFPTKTDLFFKYQAAEKSYKLPPPLYTDDRTDRRHTYTAVLSQEIHRNFNASFTFNYIDNNSTTELYDFTKETYTLSIGFYF